MNTSEQQRIKDRQLLDEWEEKYTQLLKTIVKVDKPVFTESCFETLLRNLKKLPPFEVQIHLGALALAAAKLDLIAEKQFFGLIEKMEKNLCKD